MSDSTSDWLTQLRRGVLELAVLALIAAEPMYGYQIVSALSEAPILASGEGTVYPILRRLRRDGLLKTETVPSELGPPRVYYHITAAGRAKLRRLEAEWGDVERAIRSLLSRRRG